ncbi:unnamed protein product [Somion occarium]|uniref:Large ribosomal subunit protein uL23m n=1 Tax=Somion occarium TaxID=3059160 RepID=A0ABP1E9N9_9APHY
MFFSFRRLYSTLPEAAAAARTASTPRAVRLRRARKQPPPAASESPLASDATPDGLTPTEYVRYQRQLAKAELMGPDGRDLTEGEWLEKLDERRSRIRGVREVTTKDGEKEVKVVAQKIYLPNIIFRLVRNHTLAGQPYNPYEATFRIPQSVTKTDIRSYLLAVYGVKTTYIRTDNYLAPIPTMGRSKRKHKTYKRAVVGLVDPFYYPQALEDMSTAERDERKNWLEENFRIEESRRLRVTEILRMSRNTKGWKVKPDVSTGRGNILRRIMAARARREGEIEETKEKFREFRAKKVESIPARSESTSSVPASS